MSDQIRPADVHPNSNPPSSGLATASLVCGILGFFTGGLTGLIAVILGHIALLKIRRSGGTVEGRGLAIGGLVTGYLSCLLVLSVVCVIYTLKGTAATAKRQQAAADFRSYEAMLKMYQIHAGRYPTTEQGLDALIMKPVLEPLPRRWSQVLKKAYVDPWGNPYGYHFPSKKNPKEFETTSNGPDGIAGTWDDLSSQNP
jgi:general secretion pathway protein G